MSLRIGLLTSIAALWLGALAQQTLRPVDSSWMIEAGASRLADTYLSPVKYSGLHLGVDYSRMQAMKQNPEQLIQGLNFGLNFERAKNPVGNATMYGLNLDASWRMLWRMRFAERFSFGVGGYIGANIGVLALMRNSNNPAQAQAALTIGPEAYVQWQMPIERLPMKLRLQGATPLVGAFFCPDYGELYYEIALGNHRGLTHFAWPGNRRRLKALLSLDFEFGGTTLRVGYRFDATSASANNITARRIIQSAVVGISGNYITINNKKPLNDAKTITADY